MILIIIGLISFGIILNGDNDQKYSFTGLGILGGSCFIAFAILDKKKKP